ncbi:hypothetical protein F2Q65_05340 [Thiohalocapsa marina]|uniref:Uncharacterized protein n=1 Tax=Thiohalocapsa marina TaxID=424902 RepID=A0A5M8FMW5_9GAMM|nr:hypothetical protein [Thiohalocapsa marina]KAA6186228.1 hypothetical protein F2Q65_05340 [Thiohalocapsa marina]
MEQVKKTDTHVIYKKHSGRYAVKDSKTKTWVNGDDKAAVLLAQGLITLSAAKAAAEPESEAEAGSEAAAE